MRIVLIALISVLLLACNAPTSANRAVYLLLDWDRMIARIDSWLDSTGAYADD